MLPGQTPAVILARRKTGAGSGRVAVQRDGVGVEIGTVLVDERNRLREQQRGKIVRLRDRLGDVKAMIGHVDTAVEELSVLQRDLELAAGNLSCNRIVIVHGEIVANLSAPRQGLGGVADSLL